MNNKYKKYALLSFCAFIGSGFLARILHEFNSSLVDFVAVIGVLSLGFSILFIDEYRQKNKKKKAKEPVKYIEKIKYSSSKHKTEKPQRKSCYSSVFYNEMDGLYDEAVGFFGIDYSYKKKRHILVHEYLHDRKSVREKRKYGRDYNKKRHK